MSFYSCKKNKDPEAVADFTYRLLEHGGVEVTFKGKGSPIWDFGGAGAQVGSGDIVKFYYKQNGVYTIKLTSSLSATGSTKDKQESILITDVPTKLRIKYFNIESFSTLDYNNQLWDADASGPDIIFGYYSSFVFNPLTSTYSNLQQNQLPLNYNLVSNLDFNFTEPLIQFYAEDDDSPSANTTFVSIQITPSDYTSFCSPCNSEIYPTTFNNSSNTKVKMKVGVEWLP